MLKVFGNRYAIGEMIGTGGMADVYIGEDQRLSRKVAVKVLRSDLARDPSFVARFRKEALAAAGLNHAPLQTKGIHVRKARMAAAPRTKVDAAALPASSPDDIQRSIASLNLK